MVDALSSATGVGSTAPAPVGLDVAVDRRRVVERDGLVLAGFQAKEAVVGGVGELRHLDPRLHRQLLVQDHLRGVPLRLDVQDQRRWEPGYVLELGGDTKQHGD